MPYSLENKVCLVTGANRGIGKAIVDSFMKAGAKKVYAAVRTIESAAPLVDEYGDRIVPLRVDMTDASTMTAAAGNARDVQVLVNNAGVLTADALVTDAKALENLQYEIQVNVFGFMHLVHAFESSLTDNEDTCLIQINSTASLRTPGMPSFATYSASKHCSFALTQSFRDALTPHNCRVVSVHPGFIATDMVFDAAKDVGIDTDKMNLPPPSQVGERIVAALAAEQDDFLVFPCDMSQAIGSEYESFATNVIGTKNNKPR